ncbi:histidine kinase [Pyxidicoccus fallax]|uniref:histidine kinase n=1 Tax=Pyxidicoccus fallax TaxID=394095 RepID=A0A848LKW0_9BACT|nr:MEDS domain-containing protein [Pyxidicoccus fallax]NMO18368.1 histidine kinase [Pyxidicoccus fallax]NPC83380.1 histidine kinase [Pyxidicoccus fallax]
MNLTETRPSGLSAVGELPWGAHFCQFYGDREDLVDSLVPYFKAGLDAHEKCLWVTCDPLRAEDAKTALRNAVPDLEKRLRTGQLEVLDHEDWYIRTGKTDAESTLRGWVDQAEQALTKGFAGLRLTGNTYWVERSDWDGFVDYEARVSKTFAGHRIIGMCSYCLGRCQPHDILDVVANHQFALTRRAGEWQVLESASLKRAKDELYRLNLELEHRVQERTAELQRAVAARDEFLSVASHELKTPITSLQLYVQGILRAHEGGALATEQLTARLHRVREQCGRLDKLVNNLLDVSRADANALSMSRERFDLSVLVADTAERFAEEFARARCEVSVHAVDPVTGEWDRMRLEQVFTNLFQNAVRYAPGSKVDIHVTESNGHAHVTVRDSGPGIPEREHARIFERFTQAEGPRAFAGGFGLGLWLVKQVVEAHGGGVTLASRPGAGAAFTVSLPLG